ncbi:MAG: endonuclease [Dysgonamonadaceae bacterium]|jgi:predicted extracellular nuclease|nr:endonuclease [Dysgonamonadaceae bacterium]
MKIKISNLLVLFFLCASVFGQNNFRVLFYNVENLFDTNNNPHKNDEEFLPDGRRRWSQKRYYTKINNLAKVISSSGEWGVPAVVGICETENEKTVRDLVGNSPLRKAGYRFVVTNSPDRRGINVALLYQRDQFKYLAHRAYTVRFPYNKRKLTRDILHVTGQVLSRDTVDVFVCHFPSRRGGEKASEPDRIYAASILRSKADSLMRIRRNAHIIIMGDFNDEPSNISIARTLNALPIPQKPEAKQLYNLFQHFEKRTGSYKYRGRWNMLDQIIVSGNLISGGGSFKALPHTATIFSRNFMLTEDKTNGGNRPRKTFHGMRYEGGYSDHLPVYVDFRVGDKK